MRTEYKHNPPIPYSLHDMRVKKIIIQDKTIVLEFEDGYEKLTEPFEQVEGNITIEGVDFDCTCVIFSPFKLADLSACKVEPVIAILPLVLILISPFEFKVLLIDFEVSKLALS
ncbi:hypothetical protein LZW05_03590 [Campylobacter coli]|nr:hypothetical protein [Campylobacter coli]MCE7155503.1 hypothetical protein [Campylobacter coli]MCE7198587.1 hypothetical protein [Campylobacter coli]MCE7200299.1 hypothetical protein [Campylobacter coli]MCE7201913.1 hypothetical protein [Campylobacter coli]MCE7215816.1 hypothetical protein [Campylobacter coli]